MWPRVFLEVVLMVVVAVGLWREARARNVEWLRVAAIMAIPVLMESLVAWLFFPVTGNTTLIVSFLIYVIPAFYLSGVTAMAAYQLRMR